MTQQFQIRNLNLTILNFYVICQFVFYSLAEEYVLDCRLISNAENQLDSAYFSCLFTYLHESLICFEVAFFITVSIETLKDLLMSNSMHSMSSLFKTSSCKFKDPEKKIFLVDSAKKTWFIIVVSMVAGMIRELSTLQNLLCGQRLKKTIVAKKEFLL